MGRLKRFGRAWNKLGRQNPYGAILTGADGDLVQWSDEEFFATGVADADRFLADLVRLAPTAKRARALDFGCGVGRVTRALAAHFESVVGVDGAPAMIARARELNRACGNCEFLVNRRDDLRRFDTERFDVVYSRLVLQHIPPALATGYIAELVRILAPGGGLMFQLPEEISPEPEDAFLDAPVLGRGLKQHLPRAIVRAYRRVKYRLIVDESVPTMAMFGLSRDTVERLVRHAGGRILAVEPDRSHGTSVPGFAYWVSKA